MSVVDATMDLLAFFSLKDYSSPTQQGFDGFVDHLGGPSGEDTHLTRLILNAPEPPPHWKPDDIDLFQFDRVLTLTPGQPLNMLNFGTNNNTSNDLHNNEELLDFDVPKTPTTNTPASTKRRKKRKSKRSGSTDGGPAIKKRRRKTRRTD